jgi:transcriptional regulator with GAF, ATPase, and Fis domain
MQDKTMRSASQLLDALREVLSEAADPSAVLKTILGQAVYRTGANRGAFIEVGRSGRLVYRVLYKLEKQELSGRSGEYSHSVLSKVLETGQPMRVSNALADPRFMDKASIQDMRLTSILCAPIAIDERVAALIYLESNKPNHFQDQHVELLQSLVALAGSALHALHAGAHVMEERESLRQSESLVREELERDRELLARDWSFGRFVGRTRPVRELEEYVRKASRTDFPVLLFGETGTGKSILSRVLHFSGPRKKGPFVTVFCPSLEKGMVETELFGHKKGAFTGAVADRVGKVQAADRGTLFLDEIADLSRGFQAKLLRLLQEKTYERVGDPTEQEADVRVVAATNRDLEVEIAAGRFRRDLYERLNFLPVRIPPLRERTDDIPRLLRYFLDQSESGRWVELTREAETALVELDFTWPGNVRHIEHLAARLAMEYENGPVDVREILTLLDATAVTAGAGAERAPESSLEIGLPALLAQEEKKWLEEALKRHPDLTRAEIASKLKISEAALYKKLRMYGIGR